MEISNLIEFSPELTRDILWNIRVSESLKNRLKGIPYQIIHFPSGKSRLTIYDRHEGELGFYTHDFYSDGTYELDFVPSGHTEEAEMYYKAFLAKYNPDKYKLMFPEPEEGSEVSDD